MNATSRTRSRAATAILASALLVTSCSIASGGSEQLDAKSYYDNYAEDTQEDKAAQPPTGESGAAAPDDRWPGVLDDNTFVDPGDSGFATTAQHPMSTFGLDVDTGSYSVGRKFIEQGHRPDPESIRVEEWVNAFDYEYEAPKDGDFAVHVDDMPAPYATDDTQLVRLGIQAREIADEERPPATITFVVDTSGSMDIRERLGLVKSSLALLANNLNDDDTIAVVTYGDTSESLLPPTPVRDIDTIEDAIDSLEPGGSTNLDSGLRHGYREARDAFRDDAVNAVVLASDGVANVGMTDDARLAQRIQDGANDGIHLVTAGFGMGNYNDDLMEQLADQGDGFYSYVDTFEEAERLFVDELTSTLTVVAGDAKSQVRFDPEAVREYRLLGYENRALADDEFTDDAVDAGELGAGHTVTALYEVRLAAGATDRHVGEVRLRWESSRSGDVKELRQPIPLPAAGDGDGDASGNTRLAATVAAAAELLRGSPATRERDVTLGALVDDARQLNASGADELAELLTRASER